MFVVFKNESGTYSVRPAFIGFIKNNYVRRFLCYSFIPLTLIFTLAINLILSIIVCMFVIARGFYTPFSGLISSPFHKSELWRRPRTKEDKNSKMS